MLSFITYFSLVGGVGYYLWPQTVAAFLAVTLLALGLSLRWPFKRANHSFSLLISLVGAGILGLWGLNLAEQATVMAVRGPWAVVPMMTTALLPAGLVVAGVWGRRAELVILALGASTFVTALLFPLGFGFDPFVHEATLNHLLTYGDISPKQPYYAAFYGLAQGVVHIFKILPQQVLQFGLPVLFTGAAWWSARRVKSVTPLALALSLLFLPLAIVTQGTPYALGTVFLLLTVVAAWQDFPPRAVWSLALAALLTHPIPGVLALAVAVSRYRGTLGKILGLGLASFGGPLMFLGLALLTGTSTLTLQLPDLRSIFPVFTNGAYRAWPDLFYFIGANRWWWGLLVGLGGLVVAQERRPAAMWAGLWLASNTSAVLIGSGFAFNTLPVHEQLDYALRLKDLSLLLAIPLMAQAGQSLLDRMPHSSERLVLASLSGLLAISFIIGAYPRHDAYARFGGITTSQADLEAIQIIEQDAQGSRYAVLANQAMSAMALREFGFVNRYVGSANDVYFYPIPTGAPLGLLTTDILQIAPTKERLEQAFEITKTPLVYLVIHDYWAQSEMLKARVELLGGEKLAAPDGLTVFRFVQSLN
jgi:hypothetical protein